MDFGKIPTVHQHEIKAKKKAKKVMFERKGDHNCDVINSGLFFTITD